MPGLLGVLLACGVAAAAPARPAPPPKSAPAPVKRATPATATTSPAPPETPPPATPWRMLEPGLELGEFTSPRASFPADPLVRVVRIDPERFELRLLNASAPGEGKARTARGWATSHGLVAVINASMYQGDLRSSVSLMRTASHVNNPRLSKDKAVLAFDRRDDGVPPVQIIDRESQDFESLSRSYGTLVQSIRMVSFTGRNVWSQQPRAWSTAAIGIDQKGRVLFIHARAPHTTHDLIDVLLQLPLDLKNALYSEGGPEAQLYLKSGKEEVEVTGVLEGDDDGVSSAALAWTVPNVIGVLRKP